MRQTTLIFSIALNGYQWRYRNHLASHRRYAQKHNYHYQVVTKPFFSPLGIECCWLKLTLMHTALLAGYQQVMFLDADTHVHDHCPPLQSILIPTKCIYMAKGYSKRFNSGVMIVSNCQQARDWIHQIIKNRHQPVEPRHDVGWGENSHIISHSEDCQFIKELAKKWNNTNELNLNDYIRHHNHGPLRVGIWNKLFHHLTFAIANKLARLQCAIKNMLTNKVSEDLLVEQTQATLHLYPSFTHRPNLIAARKSTTSINSLFTK